MIPDNIIKTSWRDETITMRHMINGKFVHITQIRYKNWDIGYYTDWEQSGYYKADWWQALRFNIEKHHE